MFLRTDLGAIDPGRLVFGSDSPVFDPRHDAGLLSADTVLAPARLETVLRNTPLDW